jgi:hypothetical protein
VVVGIMELGKFLIAILVFLFSIFLFPTLNETATAYTGDLSIIIHAFPLLFIVVSAVFPIFFLFKESK